MATKNTKVQYAETLCIALKSGVVIRTRVTDWGVDRNGGSINRIHWTHAEDHGLRHVDPTQIDAVWTEK